MRRDATLSWRGIGRPRDVACGHADPVAGGAHTTGWIYRGGMGAAALGVAAVLVAASEPLIRDAAALAALVLVGTHYLLSAARRPLLFYQRSPLLERILAGCPSLRGRFWPTPWCFNRHLQLALMALRDAREAPLCFDHTVRLRLSDGGTVSLEWAGLVEGSAPADPTPVLIVLPTICGDGRGLRRFVRAMSTRLGWRVVVLNRRGHGDLPLTTPRFNTLGSTDDLREQLCHVRGFAPSSPLYAVGLSAGSGLLVRYLGEEGERTPLTAAVALCPGYDTTRAFARVHPAYDRYLIRMLRNYFLRRHAGALRSAAGYVETLSARSLAGFHDRGFRLAGFSSAAEYHYCTNPMVVARGVRVPILVLNAADDPVCVVENVRENVSFVDTVAESIIVLTARGSHCAFFERVLRPASWADRVIGEYLAAVHAALAAPAAPT